MDEIRPLNDQVKESINPRRLRLHNNKLGDGDEEDDKKRKHYTVLIRNLFVLLTIYSLSLMVVSYKFHLIGNAAHMPKFTVQCLASQASLC